MVRKIKTLYKNILLAWVALVAGSIFMLAPAAQAQAAGANAPSTNFAAIQTDCDQETVTADNCEIIRYLLIFINGLSALVGVVVVIMIIVGGIEYSASGDDPQKVSSAKKKITNALIALLTFIFMYAFLQWVVPGGIF